MICGPLERNIACAGFVLSRDQQYWILYCWILCCPEINKRGVLALQRNARAFSLIQQSRLVPLQSLELQATNGRRHIRVIFEQAWGLFTCATCCVSAPHAAPKTVPRLWRLAAFNASMDETLLISCSADARRSLSLCLSLFPRHEHVTVSPAPLWPGHMHNLVMPKPCQASIDCTTSNPITSKLPNLSAVAPRHTWQSAST
jgi:hypothetical protein